MGKNIEERRILLNRFVNYICYPRVFANVVLNHLAPFIKNDETFIKMKWRLNMGYALNLKNPRTFSEKIQWLKLHDRRPVYTTMVDKCEAKKYVADIIGQEYIIPTLAVYERVEDIDFDTLPHQFVLKCTHDSGGLVICRDKDFLDKNQALRKLKKFLKRRYFWQNREWPYKNVRPRIIAEQYMGDDNNDLVDYKFYCFDGEPKYCQVIQNRTTKETIDFFDVNWVHQDFVGLNPKAKPAKSLPQKPTKYDEMKIIAKKLSRDIPFVRIDLYGIGDKVYFGECTFFPMSGLGNFTPIEWCYRLGSMIKCII